IERAVTQNVAFDTCEDAKAAQFFVQLSNRADLCAEFWFIDSVCLNGAAAVIGDAEIFQPQFLRGSRHFFDGIVSVTRSGVTMKRAPQVFLLDQLRQRMFLGSFEFAPVFP